MNVKLIACTQPVDLPDLDTLAEYCGRVCFDSTSKTGQFPGWLQVRIKAGHESIIEHVAFTFEIDGVSRACSHQLVRHRLASYSQESQRYVKVGDLQNNAVYPESILAVGGREDMEEFLQTAQGVYERLVSIGVPAEDARFVLPNATETRLIVTMNARELRHFFKLRMDKAAQWEIRAVALAMLELAHAKAPGIFSDIMELYVAS